MKITTQVRDDHQASMTVEIDQDVFESAKRRAARKISERKTIPGFRPGKAPYDVVIRNFGEDSIKEQAVDLLLDEIYPKALEESKLEPAAAGSLEKVDDLEKLPKFTFLVPLAPTVNLGDYRSIRLPYNWNEPGESELNESLDNLRQMYAKTETVDRAIQMGDFVMIDLKGSVMESTEDPIIDRPGMPIFVRSDEKEDEFPFKGFSINLLGLNVDEKKIVEHKYLKSHKDEKLQGRKVRFEILVKMIRSSILPELNDEFAKQVGPFENVQAMKEVLKANIANQSKNDYDDNYFNELLEKIKEIAILKYPPQVIEHEVGHVIEDLKNRLAQQNMDLTAYLKTRELTEEKFIEEEAKPVAIKRYERSLIFDQISKEEKIEVSRELLQSTFQQTFGEYQGDPTFKKAMKGKTNPPKQVMNAVAMESANRAYLQQTLNRLKEIATGIAPEVNSEKEDAPSSKKSTKRSVKKTKQIADIEAADIKE